ncbi:GNAT family N-acetyltransferase [Cytobacillus sp. FJAT-54145]|uniref:GNAT family N-acetyltransferase n=1 Tax=Cytobacillus spartinae TaxID=3299023 RepID=A0ABW6KCY8_9BACI
MIREITLEDAGQFLPLLKHVDESGFMLFEGGERDSSEEKERQRIERFLKDPNSTIFVAEKDHQLVGYMMVLGNTVRRTQHSAYIVVGIHADYRGMGVGKNLFQEVFRWAGEKKLKRLELTVIKRNEAALHLYKKMGFMIEGEKIGSLIIDGVPEDEFYMYKWLGE